MNEVNKTLFIPLYGKAQVNQKGLILRDQKAEEIWGKESFAIAGKAKSRWLAYFMAMRARVFDDWADRMLALHPDALVLHIGCGLDSRCLRVKEPYREWIDADFPEVIRQRSRYFAPTERYRMMGLDASKVEELQKLPQAPCAIVLLEGISMYLTAGQLHAILTFLHERYPAVYLLMDCYTEWAARASKYKNPVNEVGVTTLYGIDDLPSLAAGTGIRVEAEHSLVLDHLVDELSGWERAFFRAVFREKWVRRLYRLYELEG